MESGPGIPGCRNSAMDGGRRGRRKVVPAAGRHHGATPARFLHRSRIVPSRAGPMAPAKGHGNRMSQQTTIRKLAALVNTPVDKLLEQLAEAGMKFDDPDQVVTSTEKVKLRGFLRRTHGKAGKASEDAVAPKKITLSRSRKQELTVGGGKNRSTVDVVVRKKVTLVKRSEEHTSELQSLMRISYAVFCLKKKKPPNKTKIHNYDKPLISS